MEQHKGKSEIKREKKYIEIPCAQPSHQPQLSNSLEYCWSNSEYMRQLLMSSLAVVFFHSFYFYFSEQIQMCVFSLIYVPTKAYHQKIKCVGGKWCWTKKNKKRENAKCFMRKLHIQNVFFGRVRERKKSDIKGFSIKSKTVCDHLLSKSFFNFFSFFGVIISCETLELL